MISLEGMLREKRRPEKESYRKLKFKDEIEKKETEMNMVPKLIVVVIKFIFIVSSSIEKHPKIMI